MVEVLPVLSLLSILTREEVCYPRLGCFSDEDPYSGTLQRPMCLLPEHPEKIKTRFLLYTKDNVNTPWEVSALTRSSISNSSFRTDRESHFIIHGFTDSGEKKWLVDMCQAMLQVQDVNCFCVDWSGGSRTLYTQAANNIRVVGAEVAYFINILWEEYDYPPSRVHLIGHSLGAHAAGEAGKRQAGIGRITGLDPAQPYFQYTPAEVRLDPSDALLVDAIHTDGTPTIQNLGTGGYGMSQTVGHLDFFPNGGKQMPGCAKHQIISHVNPDDMSTLDDTVACNHLRSISYYTESIITPDGFIGFPSSSYSAFLEGTGFPCPSGGCPWMGHYADRYPGVTDQMQTFYLNTGDQKRFSRWRYKVSVNTSGSKSVLGYIALSLQGSNGQTPEFTIFSGLLHPDTKYTYFIDAELHVGPISVVKFIWHCFFPCFFSSTLGASIVNVQFGKTGSVNSFCNRETVRNNVPQILFPCTAPETL